MSIKLLPLDFGGYELPQFKESKKGDWYEYGTERPYKNTYPDYLTKLYNESSKHNQIINSKVKFIVGQGFSIEGNLSFKERAYIEGFLRMPNEDENLDDLLTKLAKDKKVYGGFSLQVRMSKSGKIAAINHIDFCDIRCGVDNNLYYYTDDWTTRNPENNEDFKILMQFPYDDTAKSDVDYLIYYKEYRPDVGVYPLPDYVSAIPYLESDAQIANFTLQNIKNNLSAGYVISFNNGQPTEEEMHEIERRFKNYATGSDNAGKPLLSFTDQASDHPEIMPIPVNGQDERFINLNNQIREEIFTAHGITSPKLFGIKDSSGLGNNADEIAVASQLYQNLQIDPEQKIFNELINSILNFNGVVGSPVHIVKIEPVQRQFSEQTVVNVMTPDEIREKIGLAPLELGQQVQMNSSEDEIILSQLKDTGYNETELEVLDTYIKPITSLEDAKMYEEQIKKESFAITTVLNELEKDVLSLLIKTPDLPITELSKGLNVPISDISEAVSNLVDAKALDKDFKPTADARDTIQKPKEETFIVYQYIERPDAPPLKTESRPFCRKMMLLATTKRYTLQQLELLTNDFGQTGISIFTKRGGWYHNPETGQNTPFCRHIWEMQVVKLKR